MKPKENVYDIMKRKTTTVEENDIGEVTSEAPGIDLENEGEKRKNAPTIKLASFSDSSGGTVVASSVKMR